LKERRETLAEKAALEAGAAGGEIAQPASEENVAEEGVEEVKDVE